ncbi:hypothetical protein I4U23_020872 [Adineta vaga]|nr:hypothetical protein I4U23_020872 [Adineta vaga]
MSSIAIEKPVSSCKTCCTKCHEHISVDTSGLSIPMNESNSYEVTPSPSSIASTSTVEHSVRDRHGILSSTLKNDHSQLTVKRRSRFERLFHHTQLINRQYMMTMTNILLQMQKEIHRLKRRTNRVEQSVIKQTKIVQPIIRIPRLTKDQLSTIHIHDDDSNVQENEAISDDNNNEIEILDPTKSKITKNIKRLKSKHMKSSMSFAKKSGRSVWINNRQKPIDPRKYCSLCEHEFSKRSNYLIHIRNIHKGKLPPSVNEQDQSLLEMNQENTGKNFDDQSDNNQSDTTRDQSVVVSDEETHPLQPSTKQWNTNYGRLRSRGNGKSNRDSKIRMKIKCNICNKFFRSDYLKKHKRRAHPDQEILLSSNERNPSSDESESVSRNSHNDYDLLNANATSNDISRPRIANTPISINIAEMDSDDAPILFSNDSNRSIVFAVTCLESYQLELVEKFLEKFSSQVSQVASIDSHTTHLITNDEKIALRSPLSMKLIEAIAHHCFCVSYRWISDCLKYDRIIDEISYEIEGDDTDVLPHGGPRRSRLIPSRHSLFQNICFMIKCTENSDIRMTNERLEDLITTCGGQIITCVTQRLLDKHQIIVLCDMLYVSERRHNYDQCRSLGIHFVSSDWVLESILEYRQKTFSLFEEVPL